MLESLFNKVSCLKACNFIKKRLQHRCFSLNIAKSLRTPFLKNIRKRLLLDECLIEIDSRSTSFTERLSHDLFNKIILKCITRGYGYTLIQYLPLYYHNTHVRQFLIQHTQTSERTAKKPTQIRVKTKHT